MEEATKALVWMTATAGGRQGCPAGTGGERWQDAPPPAPQADIAKSSPTWCHEGLASTGMASGALSSPWPSPSLPGPWPPTWGTNILASDSI